MTGDAEPLNQQGVPVKSMMIQGPAGTLHVDDGGEGHVPVVFLHSLCGNTAHWAAQLGHLRKQRRAIALDLRGHGLSQYPAEGDYRVESMAADVDAVANQLGLNTFVLVGHSMGGAVAITYATLHPERIAGLLLVDTAGDPKQFSEDQIQGYMNALESDAYATAIEDYWNQILIGSDPKVRETVMQDLRQTRKDTVVALFRELVRYDPLPAMGRYPGLKLIVFTPGNNTSYSLHNRLPWVPQVVVTGTGHWLHMDKPREFNRILDHFLETVGGAS